MTLAIAWGSPYHEGGTPGTAPFVAGAQGNISFVPFVHDGFAMGLTEGPGYATVSVQHTYAPAGGAPEYLVDTYYLHSGNTQQVVYAATSERDGIHTLTASIGYAPLPVKLILAVTPDSDPGDDRYGAAAWYEEVEAPTVSAFWTRFINSKEVIE